MAASAGTADMLTAPPPRNRRFQTQQCGFMLAVTLDRTAVLPVADNISGVDSKDTSRPVSMTDFLSCGVVGCPLSRDTLWEPLACRAQDRTGEATGRRAEPGLPHHRGTGAGAPWTWPAWDRPTAAGHIFFPGSASIKHPGEHRTGLDGGEAQRCAGPLCTALAALGRMRGLQRKVTVQQGGQGRSGGRHPGGAGEPSGTQKQAWPVALVGPWWTAVLLEEWHVPSGHADPGPRESESRSLW